MTPLTDGLLFVRWLFGFSGSTLTSGAVGPACSRCTAAAISSYFNELLAFGGNLDIDGDAVLNPLTDGLLVLRYLFGFRGTALDIGAVGNDCGRCSAAFIEPFIVPRVSV